MYSEESVPYAGSTPHPITVRGTCTATITQPLLAHVRLQWSLRLITERSHGKFHV